MKIASSILLAFATIFAVLVSAGSADAQLFVSGTGDDANTCSRTAPCKTINAAIGKVTPDIGGSVICLDPGDFGSIIIDRSVSIDCSGARQTMVTNAAAAIQIIIPSGSRAQTVHLKGLTIQGQPGNAARPDIGITIASAGVVTIEDVTINDLDRTAGIQDRRTGGQTRLYVSNTSIKSNGGVGILLVAGGVGITVLDNVRCENNAYGLAVAAGNNVSIRNSIFSGNSTAGIEADSGAQVVVDNSTITHNNFGLQSGGSIRVSNSNISFNNAATSGSIGSFGNNRFSGNVSIGSGLTPLGSASTDIGQQ